jgi:uroporphyrinogen-III synthase
MLLVACAGYKISETLGFLREHNIPACGFPILDIIPVAHEFPENIEGIFFTSSAPIDLIEKRNIPTYCIGKKTAERAKEAGFNVVYTGTGSAQDMAIDLAKLSLPKRCWHPTNPKGKQNWYTRLTQTEVHRDIVYLLKPAKELPQQIIEDINNHKITDVVLMSAMGARNFASLIIKNDIDVSNICLIVFSNQVMAEVKNFPFTKKITLPSPSLEALVQNQMT